MVSAICRALSSRAPRSPEPASSLRVLVSRPKTAWTVLSGEKVDEARVAEAESHVAARYGSPANREE